MPSPRPWDLPIDYGVVLLLGIPGAIFAARAPRGMQRLALVWLALGAFTLIADKVDHVSLDGEGWKVADVSRRS